MSVQYAKETQRSELPHVQGIQVEQPGDCVILDAASRRNLEIDTNLSGGTNNTLLSVLDKCATTMGSRLLGRWLNRPLRNHDELSKRQNMIAALGQNYRFERCVGLYAVSETWNAYCTSWPANCTASR